MRVTRLWSSSHPSFFLTTPHVPRTARECCKAAIVSLKKGSYLDALELVRSAEDAAKVSEVRLNPGDVMQSWRKSPEKTWEKYFADDNAVGWVFHCLSELIDYAQTANDALHNLARWQESAFYLRALHPVFGEHSVLIKKGHLSTYVEFDSRQKVSCLNVLLTFTGVSDDARRLFRELRTGERNFPKDVLADTEPDANIAWRLMRHVVDRELARMKNWPWRRMLPTGCFLPGYIIRQTDMRLPTSAFHRDRWRSEWGARSKVLQPLSSAIASAHNGDFRLAMERLCQFLADVPKEINRDVLVGEVCWKMVGFTQMIPQAMELMKLISTRRLPFVRPIY